MNGSSTATPKMTGAATSFQDRADYLLETHRFSPKRTSLDWKNDVCQRTIVTELIQTWHIERRINHHLRYSGLQQTNGHLFYPLRPRRRSSERLRRRLITNRSRSNIRYEGASSSSDIDASEKEVDYNLYEAECALPISTWKTISVSSRGTRTLPCTIDKPWWWCPSTRANMRSNTTPPGRRACSIVWRSNRPGGISLCPAFLSFLLIYGRQVLQRRPPLQPTTMLQDYPHASLIQLLRLIAELKTKSE
ncbi:hypothetical protein F4782DRAFT_534556 [Xylaria castorea]|nr:hypothetical protein F4782DRAFT_534556 [Xylaria castorea]